MKKDFLKIEPKEPVKEGEYMTGWNTRVFLGEYELRGVASIDVRYRPDDVATATVRLFKCEDVANNLKPIFQVQNPEGEWQDVEQIVLKNGMKFTF